MNITNQVHFISFLVNQEKENPKIIKNTLKILNENETKILSTIIKNFNYNTNKPIDNQEFELLKTKIINTAKKISENTIDPKKIGKKNKEYRNLFKKLEESGKILENFNNVFFDVSADAKRGFFTPFPLLKMKTIEKEGSNKWVFEKKRNFVISKEEIYSKEKFGENLINKLTSMENCNNFINECVLSYYHVLESSCDKLNNLHDTKKTKSLIESQTKHCKKMCADLVSEVKVIATKYGSMENFLNNTNKYISKIKSEDINYDKDAINTITDFVNFSSLFQNFLGNIRQMQIETQTNYDVDDYDELNFTEDKSEVKQNLTNEQISNEIEKIKTEKENLSTITEKFKAGISDEKIENKKNFAYEYQFQSIECLKKINESLKTLHISPILINSDELVTSYFINKIDKTNEESKTFKLSRREIHTTHSYYVIKNQNESPIIIRKQHKSEKDLGMYKTKVEENFIGEGGINIVTKFGQSISDNLIYVTRKSKYENVDEGIMKKSKEDIELFKDSKHILLPKIITCSNRGKTKETLIYPLMENDLLNTFINVKDEPTRNKILSEAVEGIQEMHRMRCVHLDVKAENVLVQKEKDQYKAYVCDIDGRVQFENNEAHFPFMGTPGHVPTKFKNNVQNEVTMSFEDAKLCDAYALLDMIRECEDDNKKYDELLNYTQKIDEQISNGTITSDEIFEKLKELLHT